MTDGLDHPIPPEAYPLVDTLVVAQAVTLMADGSPQVTPVWILREDGALSFNTAGGRQKTRNLERDPRIALGVVDPTDMGRWLQVRGLAVLDDDPDAAIDHMDAISQKYRGRPFPRREGQRRVIVRVHATSVTFKRRQRPPGGTAG